MKQAIFIGEENNCSWGPRLAQLSSELYKSLLGITGTALSEHALLDPTLHGTAGWNSTNKVVKARLLRSTWKFLFYMKIALTLVHLFSVHLMTDITLLRVWSTEHLWFWQPLGGKMNEWIKVFKKLMPKLTWSYLEASTSHSDPQMW